MEKTDSSSALMLLQYGGDDSDEESSFNEPEAPSSADKKHRTSISKEKETQSPSRRISEDNIGKQSAGLISDEEVDHHIPERPRKREHEDDGDDDRETAVPPKMMMMDVSKKMAPAVSPNDNSNSSFPDSQHSKTQKKTSKAPMRLVSYGADDMEEDEDEQESSEESQDEESDEKNDQNNVHDNSDASPVSKGLGMDSTIQLPPEPPGKCSKSLQEKISDLYRRMRQQGFDTNREIQSLTSFRNPSIYEKLIQMYHINEKGSNFPLDVYNPNMWTKDSYYDELDKAQKKDMERREKERKTKIEFISGTKKSSTSTSADNSGGDEKKRKSKWDALPMGLPPQSRGSSSSAVNLTSSATGTRATVISAVGTLTRKNTFNIINSTGPAK